MAQRLLAGGLALVGVVAILVGILTHIHQPVLYIVAGVAVAGVFGYIGYLALSGKGRVGIGQNTTSLGGNTRSLDERDQQPDNEFDGFLDGPRAD